LAYADIGEFGKAIADHSKAIQFDPSSASAFYARGLNYERLERFEKAIADYDRVIRLAPKNSDDYAARTCCIFYQGQLQGSRNEL
jgi:tetratricopeptide (TPR) repeat protein